MNQNRYKGFLLGIDMGGTLTKFVVLQDGKKTFEESFPTPNSSCEEIVNFLIEKCKQSEKRFPIERIGIGVPGVVRSGNVYTDNLPIHGTPLEKMLKKEIKIPIRIDNDANCAALAEANFTETTYRNLVMITIGTGIGGGVILDGKIRRGRGGLGEFCHMSIESTGGEPCSCGQLGCWEGYASTTALIRRAECVVRNHPDSCLAKLYRQSKKMDGILFFKALRQDCPVAKKIFDEYLDRLAAGIRNLIWIFDPEAVIMAGGITRDGDLFLDDLRRRISSDVKIEISSLQNEAGAYGAALL